MSIKLDAVELSEAFEDFEVYIRSPSGTRGWCGLAYSKSIPDKQYEAVGGNPREVLLKLKQKVQPH